MLSSVLLPAPDGPIMAVSSPDRRRPLTPFRMVLASVIKGTNQCLGQLLVQTKNSWRFDWSYVIEPKCATRLRTAETIK